MRVKGFGKFSKEQKYTHGVQTTEGHLLSGFESKRAFFKKTNVFQCFYSLKKIIVKYEL